MSRLTREDALVARLMPAVRATRPVGDFRRAAAVRHALTDDGYLTDDAILPGALPFLIDFNAASNTASSSDTVNYTAYMSEVIALPEGVWYLKARGGITGRLSGSSNLNTQIWLNDDAGSNFQVPLAASDTGVSWPFHELAAAQGEIQLQLMFRPSAGTLTIEAGYWFYYAKRIG